MAAAISSRFKDFTCRNGVGVLLLLYALFNTYLFVKFTPVYVATSCGDQTATLEKFSLGETIHVGLGIQVLCSNPNNYEVKILNDTPGHVFVGSDRGSDVGILTLMQGSSLPAKGTGAIHVHMESEISPETSQRLAQEFLGASEIPIYLELKFNVGVDINFGLAGFGTTAPFDKKCGMKVGALFDNSKNKLGPMLCRESFDELGSLPHVGEAVAGGMSFSAAQMDPERVRMGEGIKNFSIIGVGSLCYVFGFLLSYSWFKELCQYESDAVDSSSAFPLHAAALDAKTGVIQRVSNHRFTRFCTRATSGNLCEDQPAGVDALKSNGLGVFSRASSFVVSLANRRGRSDSQRSARQAEEGSSRTGRLFSLLSCGAMMGWRSADGQPSLAACNSQSSGELSGLRSASAQPGCFRVRSGTLLDTDRGGSKGNPAFGGHLWQTA